MPLLRLLWVEGFAIHLRSSSKSFRKILLLGLWSCGREARECGQPVGRACTALAVGRSAWWRGP